MVPLVSRKINRGSAPCSRALPHEPTLQMGNPYFLVTVTVAEYEARKNGSEFLPDGFQTIGIESQGFENRRGNLIGLDRPRNRLMLETRVR